MLQGESLLPEPPWCFVYEYGGCGTLLLAKRKSCNFSDAVLKKSSDRANLARVSKNERAIDWVICGKSRDGSFEKGASNIIIESPIAKLRNGDLVEHGLSDLGGDVNEGGLSDFAIVRKSPTQFINESIKWSPMRDVLGGFKGVRKSSARSIHEEASDSLGKSISVNTEGTT
ncbi:hypothetical protein Ancab_015409 [Ancistrocladus abbreviatus]